MPVLEKGCVQASRQSQGQVATELKNGAGDLRWTTLGLDRGGAGNLRQTAWGLDRGGAGNLRQTAWGACQSRRPQADKKEDEPL